MPQIIRVSFPDGQVKFLDDLGLTHNMQRAKLFHRPEIAAAQVAEWRRRVIRYQDIGYEDFMGGADVEAVYAGITITG